MKKGFVAQSVKTILIARDEAQAEEWRKKYPGTTVAIESKVPAKMVLTSKKFINFRHK